MLIYAHRGVKKYYPENTMIAFTKALEHGADGIELDVHLTKDLEVVVIHDEAIDRTTNGKGYIKDYTLAELRKFDASQTFTAEVGFQPIPTLRQVLEWLQGNGLRLNIELKNNVQPYPTLEERVLQLVREYNMEERTLISSFKYDSLVKCVQLTPDIPVGLLCMKSYKKTPNELVTAKFTSINPYEKIMEKEKIEEYLALGIQVLPFTINTPQELATCVTMNCTGVITDDPLFIRQQLEAWL